MREFLTSRSRVLEYQRCPRLRYWAHEYQGTGIEPIRQRIPLVTGGSVHLGLAHLLKSSSVDQAVDYATGYYDSACKDRGLDLEELADTSRIYCEQKALVEALVRLAHLRVVPRLLEGYEVLEVERMDSVTLWEDGWRGPNDVKGTWRSIPDGLLRSRVDGDLYLLSWKTVAMYSAKNSDDSRVDMQGLSEAWARELAGLGGEKIRGVQMVYLVKGKKLPILMGGPVDDQGHATGNATVSKSWRTNSPLLYGYRDQGFPPKLATTRYYTCPEAHPFRWAKGGQCPGGKNHKLGDDWQSFQVWESLGVENWLAILDLGVLDSQWAMPMPSFRTAGQTEHWLAQIQVQEREVAAKLEQLKHFETSPLDHDALIRGLDREFHQHTENCNWQFGSKCSMWEVCWGPAHVAQDPIASGLYQIREAYAPEVVVEETVP